MPFAGSTIYNSLKVYHDIKIGDSKMDELERDTGKIISVDPKPEDVTVS